MPQYRIVDDYWFGFAQVDVDGKSGLIDRDGKMVIEAKYGFITAIGPDRFRVAEARWVGGRNGSEDFSGARPVAPRLEDNPANAVAADGRARE